MLQITHSYGVKLLAWKSGGVIFFDKYHVCLRIAYLMLILIARRKQTNRFIHTAFSLQNVSKSLQIITDITKSMYV